MGTATGGRQAPDQYSMEEWGSSVGYGEHTGIVHIYTLERSPQLFLEVGEERGKTRGRDINLEPAVKPEWERCRPGFPHQSALTPGYSFFLIVFIFILFIIIIIF